MELEATSQGSGVDLDFLITQSAELMSTHSVEHSGEIMNSSSAELMDIHSGDHPTLVDSTVIFTNINDIYNISHNDTFNTTGEASAHGFAYPLWETIIIIISCSTIICGTILGNVLVCVAVAIVRKLRTPSNLLIVSLSISDLLVAILVMPFAIAQEIMGGWIFSKTFCDAWTSLDVMLCTASILNLCAISLDRYLVVTRPFQYAMKRTPARMAIMIAVVWGLATLISIPPLFGWKSETSHGFCHVSQEIGYQFYATIGAFYLPVTIMIVIYYRIHRVSARIARAEAKTQPMSNGAASGLNTPFRQMSVDSTGTREDYPIGRQKNGSAQAMLPKKMQRYFQVLKKSRSSGEGKATKTLGIIMGAFTACWLPFFILAIIVPFLSNPAAVIPNWLVSLFLWLGYCNSFLNPIIYARFNKDFGGPFKELLHCHCAHINKRLRKQGFRDQYGVATAGMLRECAETLMEVPPFDFREQNG